MEFSWPVALMMIQILIALILYFVLPIGAEFANSPILKISQGHVRGIGKLTANSGNTYQEFLNIPYALAPINERRFTRPQPAGPWKGILDGTKPGPICIQPDILNGYINRTVGQEDCLNLNIYKPTICKKENLCPIMVWIHGGGYAVLDASPDKFDPEYFMDYGVIVVSVNYRLGVLGFLTLEDDYAPGNLGLRDQALSLKWIKNEAQKISGDPDSITLFGQSAGGYSTMLQMISPHNKDKNLFHRVISQSGSPVYDRMIRLPRPRSHYAYEIGELLGCKKHDEMLKCLQTRSPYLIQKSFTHFNEINDLFIPNPWVPIIDGKFSSDPFIPDFPENIIKSKNFSKVPVIIGGTSEEGVVMMSELFHHPGAYSVFTDSLPLILLNRPREIKTDNDKYLVNNVKRFYLPDGKVSRVYVKGVVQMFSDFGFNGKIGQAVKLLSEAGVDVYHYLFNYSGTHSFGDLSFYSSFKLTFKLWVQSWGVGYNMRNGHGICHGDELLLMFKLGYLKPPMGTGPITERDKIVSGKLLSLWTDFARTGNPTPPGSTTIGKPEWEKSRGPNYKMYKMQTNMAMADDPDFWIRVNFFQDIINRIDNNESIDDTKKKSTLSNSSSPKKSGSKKRNSQKSEL